MSMMSEIKYALKNRNIPTSSRNDTSNEERRPLNTQTGKGKKMKKYNPELLYKKEQDQRPAGVAFMELLFLTAYSVILGYLPTWPIT